MKDGPTLSAGASTLATLAGERTGNDYTLTARYTGDLREVVWRVLGNGWLELSYRYALSGDFDFHGIDFSYPEALVSSAQWLGTAEGTMDDVVDTPGVFLRLYTPRDGVSPRTAAMRFPGKDIFFLHGIAPIGDKFLEPSALGPQSQPNSLNGQPIEGRLYFRFLPP